MERILYGRTQSGIEVDEFSIANKNGLEFRCINYGCRITRILVPQKDGPKVDVVLGYSTLAEYEDDGSGHGAFIGRYANRIAGAAFSIGGEHYALTQNEGNNFLHGSLAHRVFKAEIIGDNSISFTATSPDGEDGFPGELWVAVTYTLTDGNELIADYRATSTKDTHLNLTNHSYFNLAGSGDVLGQRLTLNCDRFLEVDEEKIPTGRMPSVAGGAFDFTEEKAIGRDIGADDPQLKIGGGYDHCFVINRSETTPLALAARACHPESGRSLRVFTSQPSVQLYTANHFDGSVAGRGGVAMEHFGGFCLETQHFPDSPHQPEFPSTLLPAKQKFHSTTVFQFGW